MKKIILSLFSVAVIATGATAQIAIAPELGLNMANMAYKYDNGNGGTATESSSMKPGLLIGANVDIGLSSHLYLQPGVFYKMNGADFTQYQKDKISVNTLEVPVNLWYRFGKPGANRFGVGVGLYLGLNLSGKDKWSSYTDPSGYVDSAGSQTLKIGSTKSNASNNYNGDNLKALDLGISLNASYELTNGLFFHLRYQMGLSNLDPSGDSNNSIKTSALSVSVGYFLKSKSKKKSTEKKK